MYQDILVDRGDFRFGGAKGYVDDDATGWQQLGARLYVPQIGRFLTQDPIGQEGGLNLYAYCGDSPLMATDPTGHDGWDNAANFFGGWGHSLTFGLTGRIAQGINSYYGLGEFEYGGGYFTAGEVVGAANGFAISGAGGLKAAAGRVSWLAVDEAVGGHAIARHVAKTGAYLLARRLGGAAGATSFISGSVAERAIMEAIGSDSARVLRWLQRGANGTLDISYDTGRTIGYGFPKAGGISRSLSEVQVALRRGPSGGFYVHTAYPK